MIALDIVSAFMSASTIPLDYYLPLANYDTSTTTTIPRTSFASSRRKFTCNTTPSYSILLSRYRMTSVLISHFILGLREVDPSNIGRVSVGGGPGSSIRFASFWEGNIAAVLDGSWFTGIEEEVEE